MTLHKFLVKRAEMMDEMPGPGQQSGMGNGPGSSDNENPQDGESLVKMEKSMPNPAATRTAPKRRIEKPKTDSHMVAYEDILGVSDEIKDLLTLLVEQHGGETIDDSMARQYKRIPRVNHSL